MQKNAKKPTRFQKMVDSKRFIHYNYSPLAMAKNLHKIQSRNVVFDEKFKKVLLKARASLFLKL